MPGGGDLVGVATWYFLCGPLFLLATLGVYILLNRHTYYQHFLDERGEQEAAAARAGAGRLGHLAVIRRTWRWNLTVFLTYVVLYSLYPALLRLVEPVHDTEAWRQVASLSSHPIANIIFYSYPSHCLQNNTHE